MAPLRSFTLAIPLLLLVLAKPPGATAAKILFYPFGHCMNSHLLNAEKLADTLIGNGHDVTMLVGTTYNDFVHKKTGRSWRLEDRGCSVVTHDNDSRAGDTTGPALLTFTSSPNFKPICDYDDMDFMLFAPLRHRFDTLVEGFTQHCEALISNRPLMARLKTAGYDLFILEPLDPCSRILADYLDIPFIPLFTSGLGHWDGNPRPPSYLPAAIAPFTSQMTFMQRLGNIVMKCMYETIPMVMGFESPFRELKTKYGYNVSLSIGDTFDRAAIKLVNSDFAIDYPAPVEPDTVLIGGFAVGPEKPLPAKLQEFMDTAGPEGVIVLTFGTITKRFSEAWTQTFANALARLPQKVIWRYYPEEEGDLRTTNITFSDNIKMMKWLPQGDLLAHPNTRLFVTHCGLNSMMEATYYGVPVVALPLAGDMLNHATKLTDHLGMGRQLDIYSLTADKLYNEIQAVLTDPVYRDNAKAVSARFRDQPMSGSERAAFWIDYVIRHKGAPHLKSHARHLTWYQYFSLDVITVLISLVCFILSGLLWVVYIITRKLVRYLINQVRCNMKLGMFLSQAAFVCSVAGQCTVLIVILLSVMLKALSHGITTKKE